MENVANIVNQVLDARGWRGKVLQQMAVEIWPEVVGPQIAQHTLAQQLRGGILYVRARSPQWTNELHFHEARVIARINGRLKQQLVHKIRCFVTPPRGIKTGALKPNWEDPTFPETPLPARPTARPRDDEAARRAAAIVAESNIEDAEVRTLMENLIASSIRAQEEREKKAMGDAG